MFKIIIGIFIFIICALFKFFVAHDLVGKRDDLTIWQKIALYFGIFI